MLRERLIKLILLPRAAHVTWARSFIVHVKIVVMLSSLQLEAGEEANNGNHLGCLALLSKL